MITGMPLVLHDDSGIRPAGQPDHCFYCGSQVGTPHCEECVVVKRTVKMRFTIELEVDVPHFWEPGFIESYFNDHSCADNRVDDIALFVHRKNKRGDGCTCNNFVAEYLDEADSAPRARTHAEEQAELKEMEE